MSERTFYCRYNEYLEQQGLAILKHQPNISLNFGPDSMFEIDTIGDRFTYIDKNGISCQEVIFTAVLKYLGYLYAEAMLAATDINWASAIINACWYMGGTCEVLRADNDSTICNHSTKSNKGRSRLRPAVFYIVLDLHMTVDLWPVRSPSGKVPTSAPMVFCRPSCLPILHIRSRCMLTTDDIRELNWLIRNELIRINHKPLNRGQLPHAAVLSFMKNFICILCL